MQKLINITKLVDVCKTIEGRKKLQKIVHILQESGFRSEFPQEFGYLHYGPYSSELREDLDQLTSTRWEFLEEKSVSSPGGYPTFRCSMTDHASECLENAGINDNPAWKSLAVELNKKSAQELEAISTVIFLQKHGYKDKALKSQFNSLKPALKSGFDSALENAKNLLSNNQLA